MEDMSGRASNGSYDTELQRTIQELESMKTELQAALDQVCLEMFGQDDPAKTVDS